MNPHSLPDLFLTRYPLSPVPLMCESVECPSTVKILIPETAHVLCNEGDVVDKGQPLADKRLPGTFAPCSGNVVAIVPGYRPEGVTCTSVTIEKNEGTEKLYRLFDPVKNVSNVSVDELSEKLQSAGCSIPCDDSPILINCVDSDCEAAGNRWYIENSFDRILQAVDVVGKVSPESRLFIAVSAALSGEKKKKCDDRATRINVKDYYPAVTTDRIISSDPVLKNAEHIGLIECSRLVELLTTLETGIPALTQKVVLTSGKKPAARFFDVPIGMSVGEFLEHAGVTVEPGAQVVFGGCMTGRAADMVLQPITSGDTVVQYVAPGDVVLSENVSCVNCGRCARVCPVGLRVDLIAKSVEFEKYDEARRLGLEQCVDCGCCTAACIVHRPLAYYCFYGKTEGADRSAADG